jgi:hypothetical protein
MQTIVFSKDEEPVSDYLVEETYQMFKNNKIVYMSNSLLLTRFRVGVMRNEIEPFILEVTDIDGSYIKEVCGVEGTLCKAHDTEILSMSLNMNIELI